MIITSFVRVIYSVKYPSNACLTCLDNGPLLLECNYIRMSKCHRYLTSKQVSYQNRTLKYLSNIKALLTCYCLSMDSYLILHGTNGPSISKLKLSKYK